MERGQENKDNSKENIFNTGPEGVSSEELGKQNSEITFHFSFDTTRRYCLKHKDGEPFFMVEYFGSLPNELSKEEEEKFTKEIREQDGVEEIVYTLKHGEVPESENGGKYLIAEPRDFKGRTIKNFFTIDTNKQAMSEILAKHSNLTPEEILQIIEETFESFRNKDSEATCTFLSRFSREIAEKIEIEIKERIILPKPQEIEVAELIEILENKKVVFYTGAGISVSGGVLGMEDLENALGIQETEKVDEFTRNFINNPQVIFDVWNKFIKSLDNPPTEAHKSLAQLAQKLNSKILSENFDRLQEGSGVEAIRISGPWLKENIQPEWLKDIDAVITISLSYDDRGFLSWYKENNLNGKIIAINLGQPSYLGSEDSLLKGDCQKVVPELEKAFAGKNKI